MARQPSCTNLARHVFPATALSFPVYL